MSLPSVYHLCPDCFPSECLSPSSLQPFMLGCPPTQTRRMASFTSSSGSLTNWLEDVSGKAVLTLNRKVIYRDEASCLCKEKRKDGREKVGVGLGMWFWME